MVNARQKIILTGVGGGAAGAALPTLAAEFTARASGQRGWAACGIKGGVKFVIGLIAYAISGRLPGVGTLFAEIFAYTSWGSILMDVVQAAYPGGVVGLAEDWAVSARMFVAGGRQVSAELGELERMGVTDVTAKAKGIL